MSGKITCYLDCVSPYSYFALLYLEKHRKTLKSYNVDIDIIPVFLGGINVGSGNKPPWTLPAKAAYGQYELGRAKRHFGVPNLEAPSFFPILSLFPQRALCYIKEKHPSLFIKSFLDVFRMMWLDGKDVSKPDVLTETLRAHFNQEQVKEILDGASNSTYKQRLNDNTKTALDSGAFGCPWTVVQNSKGESQPFFGSDRFHYMWEFLGLPWKDLELTAANVVKARI